MNALKAVDQTIKHADSSMRFVGGFINTNLSQLSSVGKQTNNAIGVLVKQLQNVGSSFDELNGNLAKFDKQATDLGKKANTLSWGLLIFAGVQAVATVAQVIIALQKT